MSEFVYTESDFHECTGNWKKDKYELSKFDRLLLERWDKTMADGHFRYQLDIEETRIIGSKNYVAQLNIKRAQERRKPDCITSVNQPFNPASFNFLKIKPQEILLELIKGNKIEQNSNGKDIQQNGIQNQKSEERNLVIINASPLEYGHVLLVPDIDACRPQILTESSVRVALEMMLLSKHRGFRLGFNSLCAMASVNHAHLHAYYLDTELFVESTPVNHICGDLYELDSMPAKGFAFQLRGMGVEKLTKILFSLADYCQKNEIAHNFYMTRGPVFNEDRHSENRTVRVYFWPRKKFIGLKNEAAFNVALVELAGHLPIKIQELFDDLDEEKIEATIKDCTLEESEYQSIKKDFINICQSLKS